ncbi:hypothetical protein P170DRAFT_480856 [Aspergillus steynii IBT 23096]|uniref:Uncharacterized protein n=1 Tax=Aspergillus steynii IBT 23096 TaxID=1392250 RepID=A0A2I2FTK5_9EURO|nr:uncharacterized protein P170DRAFT_480856 [Aspergillus steynii IBT 23096]PLB43907.1 hypothetical protein P170DRAFT_480856 [Aspergillus steynii IBT 23096]
MDDSICIDNDIDNDELTVQFWLSCSTLLSSARCEPAGIVKDHQLILMTPNLLAKCPQLVETTPHGSHGRVLLRVRVEGMDTGKEDSSDFSDEQEVLPFKEVDPFPELHNKVPESPVDLWGSSFEQYIDIGRSFDLHFTLMTRVIDWMISVST